MGGPLGQATGRLSPLAGRAGWALFAFVLAAYVAARATWFAGVGPLSYRDTDSYLQVAGQSLASLQFWAGARPWTVPLLYKLLPGGEGALTTGQLVVSLACWAALAAAVARCLRPGAWRLVAFAAVLGFSMSFAVIRWDRLLLSESVSISLTALVAAAWLELVRAPRRLAVAGVLVVNLLWVFSRDTNALLALLSALPVLVWVVRSGRLGRRWPALLAAGLVAVFAASVAATGTEEAELRRNERPLMHVVGRRVLVNPEQLRFFRQHGMPAPTPRVLAYRKRLAGIGHGLPSDPQTDAFLEWVREHGRGTLARYLVAHPLATIKPVIAFRRRLLGGVTIGYLPPGARPLLPESVAGVVYPRRVRSVFAWLGIVAAAALAFALLGAARRTWLVPLGLILLQAPHAILAYHGDTLEVARHAVVMAISLRLGILLLALLVVGALLERVVDRRRERRSARVGSAAGSGAPAG